MRTSKSAIVKPSQSQFLKPALIGMEEFCLKKVNFSLDFFLVLFTFLHPIFKSSSSDLKPQKHQNSLLFHQLLRFEIKQI